MAKQQNLAKAKSEGVLSDLAYAAGIILAISYPVLAISTGARATYQLLFKTGVTAYLPPALSAASASFSFVGLT